MKTILNVSNPVVRIIHILLTCMFLLGYTVRMHAQDLPGPPANLQTLPAGSLIIPMDNTFQINGSSRFNLKAYGLIVHLLNNNIKVKWVIKAGKVKDGIDFSATTELVTPAINTTPTVRDFRGGPFVIFAADAGAVLTLVNNFNTANALTGNNRPKVQRTLLPTVVDVRYDLSGLQPKAAILNDGGWQAIHVDFMVAASVPAANYAISAGRDLITGCYTFASEPHNNFSGPIVDTAIMSIRDFVEQGGNFLAQCQAVPNYENNILGRFQTTTGVTTTNASISTSVEFPNADLSFSQIHGAFNGSEGGSVTNWSINAAGINNRHDHARGIGKDAEHISASASKLYGGLGGMVFYLGNHDYKTMDVTGNNGIRMFMNAFLTPSLMPCTFLLLNSEIKQFSGTLTNNTASLTWTISENENADHFELEKSVDGKLFTSIGKVSKHATSGTATYYYSEEKQLTGQAYYRVIIRSNASSKKYSKVIMLSSAGSAINSSLRMMENPVASTFGFHYASAGSGVNEINIYNSSGVKVYATKMRAEKGSNVIHLPVSVISVKGLYILEIVNSRERSVTRFVKR